MKLMPRSSLLRFVHGLLLVVCLGATAAPAEAQDAPRNLSATVRGRTIELDWDAPAFDASDTIEEYVVYRDTSPISGGEPDETNADEVGRVREPENNPATTFTDTEVARGTTYYYRVSAEVRETGEGGGEESNFSNEASATLSPAVTLTNPALPSPTSQPAGAPLTVRATLQSDIGIQSATLFYRVGGADTFTPLRQSPSGQVVQYEATIAAENVTARGVDFFLTAGDTDEQTTRLPKEGFVSLPVATSGLTTEVPGGTSQTAFRMVGFPLQLDSNQLSQILEDDLGPQRPEQWRLFSISPNGLTDADGGYVEVQNFSSAVQPGDAYWIITRNDVPITTGPGVSLPTDTPYEIDLQAGWNLISNPFAFELPLSSIGVTNSSAALNDVQAYDGTFVPLSAGSDALAPSEGYLVRLSDGGTGTLQLNPSLPVALTEAKQRAGARLDWAIDIAARVQQAQDRYNTAGVAPQAATAYDDLDRFEPPPIGAYVSVAFPHTNWGPYRGAYRRDVRPPTANVQDWTFEVRSNVRDAVTLSFSGLAAVPSSLSVWLVSEALGMRQNLRATPRYRFNARTDGKPVAFRLLVGPSSAMERVLNEAAPAPEQVQLFANYPNPFTPSTTIRYALPEARPVTLRVYDLLGREVATLRSAEREPAGTHTVVWDGRANDGQLAASGTYLYRLEAGGTARTGRMVLVR